MKKFCGKFAKFVKLSTMEAMQMAHKRMTAEEYRLFIAENARKKPHKHRNRIVYIYEDGFVTNEKSDIHGRLVERYDSIKEYERWGELRLLEKAGSISGLKKQVPLVVYPAFTDGKGRKHRAVTYKADFVYMENGREVVEDVKAYDENKGRYLTTAAFNLKWKMLQGQYPERIFRLF